MKIVVIGASGTLGKKVVEAFEKDHEVIKAGSKSGDFHVDISSTNSIHDFFRHIGTFDALISTTGNGHFGPIAKMTDKDFRVGIDSKLLGQVNLVLIGQHYINEGGSFTLTSGIICDEPILNGLNLSTVNAGINAFVAAAAIELHNGVRINAVCPSVVEDSPAYFPSFPGYIPVSMERVKAAYVQSVLGARTGQVFKVY